jgi:hypothetical protein
VKIRCKFCGSPEERPGLYECGSVEAIEFAQSARCWNLTNGEIIVPETEDTPPNCWRRGRTQSPERMELEAMEVGTSKLYPEHSLKRIERARNVIAEQRLDRKVVIRKEGEGYRAAVVPRVDDVAIGERLMYSDSFAVAFQFVRVANGAYLDGREEQAFGFFRVNGVYWIERVI